MPTLGKSTLIGWLAVIHGIRERKNLQYPDVPGIGRLLCLSNQEEWEEICYSKIEELGVASGLTYLSYINSLCAPNVLHGASADMTIERGDADTDYDPTHMSRRRRRKQCRRPSVVDSTSATDIEDACRCMANKKRRGRRGGDCSR